MDPRRFMIPLGAGLLAAWSPLPDPVEPVAETARPYRSEEHTV